MDWLKRPMLFNGPDWGFGDEVLRETTLPTPSKTSRCAASSEASSPAETARRRQT